MKTLKATLILALLMAWVPFIAEAQQGEAKLEFANATTALDVVQQYINGLKSGDVSKMEAVLSNNVMIYGLGGGLDSLTKAQHKEYFTNSTSTYTHSIDGELYLPVKVTNNWNEGEWVLAWGTNTLTRKDGNSSLPHCLSLGEWENYIHTILV